MADKTNIFFLLIIYSYDQGWNVEEWKKITWNEVKWGETKMECTDALSFIIVSLQRRSMKWNDMDWHIYHLVVCYNVRAPGHYCSMWCFRPMRRRAWYIGFHDLHMQVGTLAQSSTHFLWTLLVLADLNFCTQLSAKIMLRIWRNRRFWICGSDLLCQKTSWEYSHAETLGCRCALLCRILLSICWIMLYPCVAMQSCECFKGFFFIVYVFNF